MKKTSVNKSTKTVGRNVLAHRIGALVAGQSVVLPDLGVVRCTQSARAAKDHKRKFSVSKSKVAVNRGGYTLPELVRAFGLKG